MSHILSVEISDRVFEAIRADAAASGTSPSQVAARTLEQEFANGAMGKAAERPSTMTLGELQAFLSSLPKLGDDADAFIRDLRAIRAELPAEINSWD